MSLNAALWSPKDLTLGCTENIVYVSDDRSLT